MFEIKNGKKYLDLGCGNGYVTFELAERFKDIEITGLDIAANSIRKNNDIKKHKGIKNIYFDCYDGNAFPYADENFTGIISRYSFHHYPDVNNSIEEIRRVLEPDGFFILSDPMTYDDDKNNFIDRYQSCKEGGHVHFYRKNEIERYFFDKGFEIEKEFYSFVRYPRKLDDVHLFLLNNSSKEIKDRYKIEIIGDEVFVMVKVMNIFFRKCSLK